MPSRQPTHLIRCPIEWGGSQTDALIVTPHSCAKSWGHRGKCKCKCGAKREDTK